MKRETNCLCFVFIKAPKVKTYDIHAGVMGHHISL